MAQCKAAAPACPPSTRGTLQPPVNPVTIPTAHMTACPLRAKQRHTSKANSRKSAGTMTHLVQHSRHCIGVVAALGLVKEVLGRAVGRGPHVPAHGNIVTASNQRGFSATRRMSHEVTRFKLRRPVSSEGQDAVANEGSSTLVTTQHVHACAVAEQRAANPNGQCIITSPEHGCAVLSGAC